MTANSTEGVTDEALNKAGTTYVGAFEREYKQAAFFGFMAGAKHVREALNETLAEMHAQTVTVEWMEKLEWALARMLAGEMTSEDKKFFEEIATPEIIAQEEAREERQANSQFGVGA